MSDAKEEFLSAFVFGSACLVMLISEQGYLSENIDGLVLSLGEVVAEGEVPLVHVLAENQSTS